MVRMVIGGGTGGQKSFCMSITRRAEVFGLIVVMMSAVMMKITELRIYSDRCRTDPVQTPDGRETAEFTMEGGWRQSLIIVGKIMKF